MKSFRILTALFSVTAVMLLSVDLKSLPASSFIIVPSGISASVYSERKSAFMVESDDEDFTLPVTVNQRVLSVKSGNGKSSVLVALEDNPLPAESKMDPYLRTTQYIDKENESIKKTAKQFRKSKDPLGAVSHFVFSHITDKKIGIPLIPSSSILRGKTGDCTEHSVLTISILRALGIHSRAVIGMILSENFSGKQNIFVYHMWVEAFYDGKWRLLDSTRPYEIRHNRYIALAYHNLMSETPLEYLQAISTMQNMKIYYINR